MFYEWRAKFQLYQSKDTFFGFWVPQKWRHPWITFLEVKYGFLDFTGKQRKTGEYHWFSGFRRITYDQIHLYFTSLETSISNKGRKKAVFRPKNVTFHPHKRRKMGDFGILRPVMSFVGVPWMACKVSALSVKRHIFWILGASEMKDTPGSPF